MNLEFLSNFKKRFPNVILVGVTKGQNPNHVKIAIENGLTHLGNNYVQEGEKWMRLFPHSLHWSFIGKIQSNKLKHLLKYSLIQSVSSIRIAQKLSDIAIAQQIRKDILLEINLEGEETKAGFSVEEIKGAMANLLKMEGIRVQGLMALPPPLQPVMARTPIYRKLYQLFQTLGFSDGAHTLSAGTSDDFELAIEHGANMVRLGTILFGPRN